MKNPFSIFPNIPKMFSSSSQITLTSTFFYRKKSKMKQKLGKKTDENGDEEEGR